MAEQELESSSNIQLFRATEIYIRLKNENVMDSFENLLDEDLFHIIGRNHSRDELIVQSRNFSPTDLEKAINFLKATNLVTSTRLSPWVSSR